MTCKMQFYVMLVMVAFLLIWLYNTTLSVQEIQKIVSEVSECQYNDDKIKELCSDTCTDTNKKEVSEHKNSDNTDTNKKEKKEE